MKIKELTICLHCGFDNKIVKNQMEILNPISKKYKIYWNNRIDRFPYLYPSYSELMNHTIATCNTEWMVFINDRVILKLEELEKLISLLDEGYSCVFMYNAGFMGFSKELIRSIGWWDQRFTLGGFEDRDWVFRIKENNLSLYESLESNYDFSFKSPLNGPPGVAESYPHWVNKYDLTNHDRIIKLLDEESYPHWDSSLGQNNLEIKNSWKTWSESKLHINYGNNQSGSSMINNRPIVKL